MLVTLIGVCVMSLPNLADPFIRHDDYPALFADPSLYWGKTLHEGRWGNYLWHLREIETPAWLNFALYQICWAALSLILATTAMKPRANPWFITVLALLILVAPSATFISLWFNTSLPGLAIVTIYAILGCTLSQRRLRALLPLFVVISFWTYTTHPFLLLAICLMTTEQRSPSDLFKLMMLFIGSFALAVLLTYALNWQIHGIFGVPLASWRNATPAMDLQGLIANWAHLEETFRILLVIGTYHFPPAGYFQLGLLVAATVILIARAPSEALYLHAGLWAGMALIVIQVLKLGVVVPARTFVFAWVFYAVIVVRATALLSEQPGLSGRIMRNLILLVMLSYLVQNFTQYATYRPWQAQTQELAGMLKEADPSALRPVLVYGDVETLQAAQEAHLQNDLALQFRMQQLTGHRVLLCHSDPEACAQFEKTHLKENLPPPLRVQVDADRSEFRLGEPKA